MGEVISLQWRQRKKIHDDLDERNKRERILEDFVEGVMDLYETHFKPDDVPDIVYTARMIYEMGIDKYLLEQCRYYGLINEPW